MVSRKDRKLEYAFRQKEKGIKNKECAYLCAIGVRWFQKLYAEYKMAGTLPRLNWERRPKTCLNDGQKALIAKAMQESQMQGAVHLRLYIKKHYGENIAHNKIHAYLLKQGIAMEDKEKKKQRIYRLYARDHSFSLGHLDWHHSKCIPGKQVCVLIDDASRNILAGGEFDNALEDYTIQIVEKGMKDAWNTYSSVWRQMNTDKGSQFYANTKNADGEKGQSRFELFLAAHAIKHIPSRRNHPQTNGKNERWFRTYEENRMKFASFDAFIAWYNNRIHLGLSRKEGITPNEAIVHKLQPESLIGLFFRRFD